MFVMNELDDETLSLRFAVVRMRLFFQYMLGMNDTSMSKARPYILQSEPAWLKMFDRSDSSFSEDYAHFEAKHSTHPSEAESVFKCVSELRSALTAFRLVTTPLNSNTAETNGDENEQKNTSTEDPKTEETPQDTEPVTTST